MDDLPLPLQANLLPIARDEKGDEEVEVRKARLTFSRVCSLSSVSVSVHPIAIALTLIL